MRTLLSLTLACLTFLPASAQKAEEMTEYFNAVLTGQTAKAPSRYITPKELDTKRAEVWKAWTAAVRAEAGDTLPRLDSLSLGVSARWALPAALEPSATMPFYYGAKGTKPAAGYPLFLYLHGSGPKQHEWTTGLALVRMFDDGPSAYLVPQIPNEGEWYRWYQRSKQWAFERMLRQALASGQIDASRLYILGISEGGYGSQRLASFYADYWAGAGPMAGGEPLKNAPAENLTNVAFYFRTGAEDYGFYRNLLTSYTAAALDSLETLYPSGYRHRVELLPGFGHAIDYTKTTPWLAHFRRNAHPRHFVWEDFEMDGRHRTGFANILVEERPDSTLRTRYDFSVEDNEVRIAVENVRYTCTERDPHYGIELRFTKQHEPATHGRFTLFLDEELIDLSRLVTVSVNGRQVYKGKVKLSTGAMERSLAAFYDPLRIFPISLEVNLK